jgi:hypothetical protein
MLTNLNVLGGVLVVVALPTLNKVIVMVVALAPAAVKMNSVCWEGPVALRVDNDLAYLRLLQWSSGGTIRVATVVGRRVQRH